MQAKSQQSKLIALSISLALLLVHINTCILADSQFIQDISVYNDCFVSNIFVYQFFHATWWHLASNVWVILSIGFYWQIKPVIYLLAYLSSVLFGILQHMYGIDPRHVVGASSVIYSIMGIYLLNIPGRGRISFLLWVLSFMVLFWAFVPAASTITHAICFAFGIIISVINYPFFNIKKS